MIGEFNINTAMDAEKAAEALAPFFPDLELTGYVVIGFDGSPSPSVCTNASGADQIIAALSAVLFGMTSHHLTGQPSVPEDLLQIPYRRGAETATLACPACGCIGWARTPEGVRCSGCGRDYEGREITALIERAAGPAS